MHQQSTKKDQQSMGLEYLPTLNPSCMGYLWVISNRHWLPGYRDHLEPLGRSYRIEGKTQDLRCGLGPGGLWIVQDETNDS